MKVIALKQTNKPGPRRLHTETVFFSTKMLFALALILAVAGVVQAAQQTSQTSNDLPFYARLERGLIHTDGEWAAIAFYRPPTCVRSDFNMLDFFDVPAAFGCNATPEPYLTGFGIFRDGPFAPPTQSRLRLTPGQTMPVWFVRWSELDAAIADDSLTIGELAALPSLLVGEATFYSETLHPLGAAKQTMTNIVAFGDLEDERTFTYLATETHSALRHVEIEFSNIVQARPEKRELGFASKVGRF
jgi:hypothetical protein